MLFQGTRRMPCFQTKGDWRLGFLSISQSPVSKLQGCEKPILDEFLSSVLNQWWHESCFKCTECGSQLTETCYSRDGKTFCRDDFYRYQKFI